MKEKFVRHWSHGVNVLQESLWKVFDGLAEKFLFILPVTLEKWSQKWTFVDEDFMCWTRGSETEKRQWLVPMDVAIATRSPECLEHLGSTRGNFGSGLEEPLGGGCFDFHLETLQLPWELWSDWKGEIVGRGKTHLLHLLVLFPVNACSRPSQMFCSSSPTPVVQPCDYLSEKQHYKSPENSTTRPLMEGSCV